MAFGVSGGGCTLSGEELDADHERRAGKTDVGELRRRPAVA